jgi:ABC-type dipeptide/oligopeptide/nickel transport system permease subunit
MTETSPLMPAWLALPVAAVVLLVLAGHLLALNISAMPPRRRRIRMATTVLMMLVTPLLGYGLGVVSPAQARMYVLVWVLVASLLFMILLLAVLDMTTTLRLHRTQLRELRERMATARAEAQGLVRKPKPGERPDA